MTTVRSIDYSAGGRRRLGTLYQSGEGGGRPAVVVQHGLFVSRTLPQIDRFCRALSDDFDIIAVDLRGHGDAPGLFTWGRFEQQDLADLVSHLHQTYPAVGLLGFSIGGYTSILSVAMSAGRAGNARPEALCTVGAPAHLDLWRYRIRFSELIPQSRKVLARRGRWLRPSLRGVRWVRALDVVDRVSPTPLMIVHGDADWLVDPAQAHDLYEAAKPPKQLHMIPGGVHAEYIIDNDMESLRVPVKTFFERQLASVSPGRE